MTAPSKLRPFPLPRRAPAARGNTQAGARRGQDLRAELGGALIEDGRRHLLMDGMIETGCPVRILQGVQDPDVPWRHAIELTARFARDDIRLSKVT